MSHLSGIKALYDQGDYLQAREACLRAIYECQEHAFLHSGTELEQSKDQELKNYIQLKDRVSFHEMREYFNRKTAKGWNQSMLNRLHHFMRAISLLTTNQDQEFLAWGKSAPGSRLFSEYKQLLRNLDKTNILAKRPEVFSWLKSIPQADKRLIAEIESGLGQSLNASAQTPFASHGMQNTQQLQLPLFPSQ